MAVKEALSPVAVIVCSILFQREGVLKAVEISHQVPITGHLHPVIQVLQDPDPEVHIPEAHHIHQVLLPTHRVLLLIPQDHHPVVLLVHHPVEDRYCINYVAHKKPVPGQE